MTQEEANKLMEDVPYDMGKRIAEILETMWFTFLYAPIVPVGAFISFAGLVCYYWVDKYNLLRRCSVTRHVSSTLLKRSFVLLDLVLLWFSAGSLLFDIQIKGGYHWTSIVFVVLSVIYLFIPWDIFLDYILDEKFELEEKTYSEIKDSFIETYHTLHPIRRALHIKKFLRRISESGQKRTVFKDYGSSSKLINSVIESNLPKINSNGKTKANGINGMTKKGS